MTKDQIDQAVLQNVIEIGGGPVWPDEVAYSTYNTDDDDDGFVEYIEAEDVVASLERLVRKGLLKNVGHLRQQFALPFQLGACSHTEGDDADWDDLSDPELAELLAQEQAILRLLANITAPDTCPF